jgi:hypothetical protein
MLIEKTVSVPKEMQEVFDLVQGVLVKLVVEKKPLAEIATSELPALMIAIDGAQNIPAEFAEKKAMLSASALFGVELTSALLKW